MNAGASANIRELRKKTGLSQRALADLVGCTRISVNRAESGRQGVHWAIRTLLFLLCEMPEAIEVLRKAKELRDGQ